MAEYDSPWKNMLEDFFPQFLAFFFPSAAKEIDWPRGFEFRETELQKVSRDAAVGKLLVDKLIRVNRKARSDGRVHLHIEIQGNRQGSFPRRVFHYYTRLAHLLGGQVVSLVVLADMQPRWRPNRYETALWGQHLRWTFPMVKITDYLDEWEQLESDPNPFATVVRAHLKAKQTGRDIEDRYAWKLRLIKQLYNRQKPKAEFVALFNFIDWVLDLPENLEKRIEREILEIEEEMNVDYVSTIERRAEARGIALGEAKGEARGIALGEAKGEARGIALGEAKGEKKALRATLETLLRARFNDLPLCTRTRIREATVVELNAWIPNCLLATSLEDVFETKDHT